MTTPLTMSAEQERVDRRIVDEDRWQVPDGEVYNALERAFDEVDALRARLAEAEAALVDMAIPYEALLMDAPSRKWIAPEVWAHIERAATVARAYLAPERPA